MRTKTAVITGITGQDGSYLAEMLLAKGYKVYGVMRRSSTFSTDRIEHLYEGPENEERMLELVYGDLADSDAIPNLIKQVQPDEFYNLGAQSHVKVSFELPEYTANIDAVGVLRVLEAIRKYSPKTKFYQASSSEMYGKVHEVPQKETTPVHPRSPYGCAKVFGFEITRNYREAYGIFGCNGILFNHESPRRGGTFVTRKITRAVACIKIGKQDKLTLGNLDAKRDWGYAPEYVEAMWLMLQHKIPDDYVIATGETHTVREFCEVAFARVGIELKWKGKNEQEQGIDVKTGAVRVMVDKRYFRPSEVELLIGDSTKAKTVLGWKPKTMFKELVELMVDADVNMLRDGTDFKYR
jgi:GDPmannose 4,6-dehydratase